MSEVIEIESSEDEQPQCNVQSSQESADSEPEITDQKVPLPAPNQILEIRRKRIDGIFAEYARHHNWLLNLEQLMNPKQLQRWQTHLDSKGKPIPIEPEELRNLREMRETYMAEHLPEHLRESPGPLAYQSRAPARYQRRRPAARKRKHTKRRSAPRTAAVRKKPSASRTQNYRSQTSSTQSTNRPSTSGYSRVTVKSEKARVKSEPGVKVKKERYN